MSPELHLDAEVGECGDAITGTIAWADGMTPPVRAAVRLRHRADGAGLVDETDGHDPVRWDESGRFSCPIPAVGPISFSGRLVSVSWSVEVVDLAADAVLASAPVTVVPTGGLALWAQRMAGPPAVT
ncbi:MAG: hypothetical protein ACE367_19920 [Acidimicrobiales bacterium]